MSSEAGAGTSSPAPAVKRPPRGLAEALGLLAILSLSAVVVAQMLRGPWANYMFYNGDSVVLPLIEKSIAAGDEFQWVFSSQLFLFPEALLYAVSSAFTDDPRIALLVNAFVNILVLYGVLRSVAAQIGRRVGTPARWQIAATVATTATLLFYVVLEPAPDINRTTLASLSLMTTYYFGTVLAGLALFSLTLWFVGRSVDEARFSAKRAVLYVAGTLVVGGLSATSNPLFLLQYVAPSVVLFVVLLIFRALSWRAFGTLVVANLLVVPVSTVGRSLLSPFVSADVSDYLQFDLMGESVQYIKTIVMACFATERGTLEFILSVAVLYLSCHMFVRGLYRRARQRTGTGTSAGELLSYGFGALSAIALLFGFVVTGSMTTRYLLPLLIFPLVGLIVALLTVAVPAVRRVPRSKRYPAVRPIAVGTVLAVIAAGGVWGSVSAARSLAETPYTFPDCLDEFRGDEPVNGVASFWLARQLELYQDSDGAILQVKPDLEIEPWMVNLAAYEDRDFTFVLVQREGEAEEVVDILGVPARTIDCPEYDILDYESAPGEEELNAIIDESLEENQLGHGFPVGRQGGTPEGFGSHSGRTSVAL